ncbi:FAD binding domain-containing protein [Streptomyces acidiscabies]|uniref:Xanthine dehydrogenase family protein subunit M n=1 Tax=Streptomyces acidiscabies TaxID=42234 RepID=A0AAP6BBU7_9ACTN|nr:xanthine dehydrogenase family protein subunit M [Streptomyces acidiscabies]MBZ3917916.1 xanthine dehydrogenase family protein subunit M [Streptomyces acidiscabies]MDX2961888.1 xanthine dehydrogenase family protein subunit M [Streptomyces acidiscabies]MDX3021772.1 xanthine dehydrogenase family protein subunit M [Streptomyces acidiscabies]MDX3789429.1 xanthine dehydrogenase family protein subunit M [Streptomyces acidiscabies]GAQ50412.1 4-hydroxybenzoyl-CoA reductase subunit beta [Streptomyces
MHPFSFTRAADTREALDAGRRGGRYIAGGTTLVDLMRETVERPGTLVDITGLPLRDILVTQGGGLRIGALVTMADAARHPTIRLTHPVISQALELSASAQLRNMATIGGNIMQRTRCTYFRDVTADCNKREPGSGCAARDGFNRSHAVLGTSDACVATHPSDVAVAFAALEASVHLLGPDGDRRIPFADFLLQPGGTPHREQALEKGELITAVEIPALPRPLRSGYLKVRDRQSYEFALTSAAVALHIRGGVIREAKVAAGGVGTVPWKLPAVEQRLAGERPSAALWTEAAARAEQGTRPLAHNRFKVALLRRTVERQLRIVGGSE